MVGSIPASVIIFILQPLSKVVKLSNKISCVLLDNPLTKYRGKPYVCIDATGIICEAESV